MKNTIATDLLQALPSGTGEIVVHEPELRAAVIAAAFHSAPGSQVAIVADAAMVEDLRQDITSLLSLADETRPFFIFPEGTPSSGGAV